MSDSDSKKVHWLNLRYTEQQCPGMRDILASAPFDQQSALVRGILYQWCLVHKQQGTLELAMSTALNGPGVKGERGLRRSMKERVKVKREMQPKPAEQALSPPTVEPNMQAIPSVSNAEPAPVATPEQPSIRSAHIEAVERRDQSEQPPVSGTAADALFNMFDS